MDSIWVSNLSNSQLACELKNHGVAIGPVVHTTRSLYERKLVNILNKENNALPETGTEEPSHNLRHGKKIFDSGSASVLVEKTKQLKNKMQNTTKEKRKRSLDLARQQVRAPKQDSLFEDFMASDTSACMMVDQSIDIQSQSLYVNNQKSDANIDQDDDVDVCATDDSSVQKDWIKVAKKTSYVKQKPLVVVPEYSSDETRRDKVRKNPEIRQRNVIDEDRPDAKKKTSSDHREVDVSLIRSPKFYVPLKFNPSLIKPRKTLMEMRAEREAKEKMEKMKLKCNAKLHDKPSVGLSFFKKMLLVAAFLTLAVWVYSSIENDNTRRLLQ